MTMSWCIRLSVILLFWGSTAVAQLVDTSAPTGWQGRVVDQQTREPLPFATIFVASRRSGTVANAEGQYAIKLANVTAADTIAFSSVGYKTHRIPLTNLLSAHAIVPLKRAVATLPEATVRAINADNLVREAIRLIPRNYVDTPTLLQGFYREWVKEKAYLVFAEGSLELYKAPYNSGRSDEVRLLKGRRKALIPYVVVGPDTCRLPDITNGPHLGILSDIVKGNNGDNSFLTRDRINQYTCEYNGLTSLDGNDVYSIRFTPLPDALTAYFEGHLLIDRATKAIIQANYTLSERGMGLVNLDMARNGLPLRLEQRRYVVNYRKQNGYWYLQHAQATNVYRYILRQMAPIWAQMNFVVTSTTDENVHRFAKKDVIRVNQTFAEEVRAFDDSFWQGQTILVEDQP